MIPFNRPSIGDAEYTQVLNVMNSGWLTEGPVTQEFETKLSEYLGAPTCVVNSGSSALMCALLADGFKAGDTVVVPAITHIATLTAAYLLGAQIRIVDVDLNDFNMPQMDYDANYILPVDVGGVPCNLMHCNGKIIHDAAQSFGARPKFSRYISCYSFQMTKQLNCVEGGCIVSPDIQFINKCRRIKNYGRTVERYVHDIIGTNWRTTDINSAIGIEQLKKIDQTIRRRREIIKMYKEGLKNVEFQVGIDDASPMFCFVRVASADQTIKKLIERDIDARKIWKPLNLQPIVRDDLNIEADNCENAFTIWHRTVSLPISDGLTDNEINTIIREFNRL